MTHIIIAVENAVPEKFFPIVKLGFLHNVAPTIPRLTCVLSVDGLARSDESRSRAQTSRALRPL